MRVPELSAAGRTHAVMHSRLVAAAVASTLVLACSDPDVTKLTGDPATTSSTCNP